MDLISVIIPVYKVEKYIRECVDSVIHQTYTNLEIILVDDGSPDNCGAICDEYARKDARIRSVHKTNGGLSDARNAGIEQASGDWLMFVDSDDYIEPTMAEELYSAAITSSADMSVCGVLMFRDTETGRIENKEAMSLNTGLLSGTDILKSVQQTMSIPSVYVVACNKLYRKALFQDMLYNRIMSRRRDDSASHSRKVSASGVRRKISLQLSANSGQYYESSVQYQTIGRIYCICRSHTILRNSRTGCVFSAYARLFLLAVI